MVSSSSWEVVGLGSSFRLQAALDREGRTAFFGGIKNRFARRTLPRIIRSEGANWGSAFKASGRARVFINGFI
jgi:hypothetical protein